MLRRFCLLYTSITGKIALGATRLEHRGRSEGHRKRHCLHERIGAASTDTGEKRIWTVLIDGARNLLSRQVERLIPGDDLPLVFATLPCTLQGMQNACLLYTSPCASSTFSYGPSCRAAAARHVRDSRSRCIASPCFDIDSAPRRAGIRPVRRRGAGMLACPAPVARIDVNT